MSRLSREPGRSRARSGRSRRALRAPQGTEGGGQVPPSVVTRRSWRWARQEDQGAGVKMVAHRRAAAGTQRHRMTCSPQLFSGALLGRSSADSPLPLRLDEVTAMSSPGRPRPFVLRSCQHGGGWAAGHLPVVLSRTQKQDGCPAFPSVFLDTLAAILAAGPTPASSTTTFRNLAASRCAPRETVRRVDPRPSPRERRPSTASRRERTRPGAPPTRKVT